MSYYRVVLAWHQGVIGASETYVTKGDDSGVLFAAHLQELLNRRNAMMFNNCEWDAVRISDLGAVAAPPFSRRRVQLMIPGKHAIRGTTSVVDVPERGVLVATPVVRRPDQQRVALKVRMALGNGSETTRYLAGIPDSISGHEPATFLPDGDPDWFLRFAAFSAVLIDKWAVVARTTIGVDPVVKVSDLVLEGAANTRVGIQVNAATAPTITVDDKIHLRGFRPCPGVITSINGIWNVSGVVIDVPPTGRRTIWLRGSEGIDPKKQQVMGTMQRVGYVITSIQEYSAVGVGVHRRGKPWGSPVGRRKRRLLRPC